MKGEMVMTLKEHYKFHTRKSIKPYFKLIILFFIAITVSHTFGRYTYTTTNQGTVAVAKWNVKINGEEITDGVAGNISLLNAEDNTTNIDSGDECYFDVTINPTATEVAVFYSISVDLDESNLPDGTKIVRYEKYTNIGENEELSNTENVNEKTVSISENITLNATQSALDDTSVRRYRIYCKIPFPIDIEKNDEYTLTPHITVKQLV